MDGIPSTTPDVNLARQIAFGFNFTPVDVQFFDQFEYASGDQVFTFAVGDNTVNIQYLIPA